MCVCMYVHTSLCIFVYLYISLFCLYFSVYFIICVYWFIFVSFYTLVKYCFFCVCLFVCVLCFCICLSICLCVHICVRLRVHVFIFFCFGFSTYNQCSTWTKTLLLMFVYSDVSIGHLFIWRKYVLILDINYTLKFHLLVNCLQTLAIYVSWSLPDYSKDSFSKLYKLLPWTDTTKTYFDFNQSSKY